MEENSQTLFLDIQSLEFEDLDVEDELVEELLEPETEPEYQPKNEIRQYPCLYQITSKEYLNKFAKDAIWHKISASISSVLKKPVSVPECRKYWDALKESTRLYLDEAKVHKICGAPADLLDLYQARQYRPVYRSWKSKLWFIGPSWHDILFEESFTVPEAPTNRRNQGQNRSHKNGHMDEQLDEALSSVATSLSKLVEAKSSSDGVTNLKLKEFHIELDKILRQMPFLQGMQFCMDMVKQANEALENGYGN
ncbi:hypothetical protein RP20_CCG024602 [Aedes albopictus]|nr:hypothetical protein RP20_CCG024602 [Aedes albopictus]